MDVVLRLLRLASILVGLREGVCVNEALVTCSVDVRPKSKGFQCVAIYRSLTEM